MRIRNYLILSLLLVSGITAQTIKPPSLPPGDSPPPTVFDRIKDAGTAGDFDSASYAIVYDLTVNSINEKGITYTEDYILYKVLTEEGCKELSVLTWGYQPLSNMIEIREINIIRGDSALSVPLSDIIDLPAPQRAIYWSDRIKSLQLPRLHVGDGIEVKTFKKGFSYALLDSRTSAESDDDRYIPPMPGEYFDIVLFEAEKPLVEKKYVLKLPGHKRLHSQVYNGPLYSNTDYTPDTTIYSWWTNDIPAWESQRYNPDPPDILTKVVLATVENWEAKSRWFFDVNEPQFEYTDAIKAKVDEILAEAGVANGTEEQKAFELVHWVAQNIRYSGQTMGKAEGYTLHSGAMIFEQRSGVCKDIAGMLITMLRAAGLDSYGAMTMAGSRIESVPADQFNHCVVVLKKEDGRIIMYDPTWVPFDKDIWSKFETEQHYLPGLPEGDTLCRISYSPPSESPLRITSSGTVQPDGTLMASLELSGDGAMDNYLRGMLAWYPLAEVEIRLARMLGSISERVEILSFKHGDPLHFKKSMWWKVDYRIPEFAFIVDSAYEFKSPLLQITKNNRTLFRAAGYDWPEKRRDDVFLYFTQLLDGNETLKLPSGYEVIKPKQSKVMDETYAYFKGESEMTNRGFIVKVKAEIRRRQIPQAGYAGFRGTINEYKNYAGTVFHAEKGGSK